MTRTFFKDQRGNFFALDKVIGLVVDKDEEDNQIYLVVLDGGIQTLVSKEMYTKLLEFAIIIEMASSEGM